jgi:hypothetical protein
MVVASAVLDRELLLSALDSMSVLDAIIAQAEVCLRASDLATPSAPLNVALSV